MTEDNRFYHSHAHSAVQWGPDMFLIPTEQGLKQFYETYDINMDERPGFINKGAGANFRCVSDKNGERYHVVCMELIKPGHQTAALLAHEMVHLTYDLIFEFMNEHGTPGEEFFAYTLQHNLYNYLKMYQSMWEDRHLVIGYEGE